MSGMPPPAATGAKPEDEDKVRAEAKEIVERAKKDLGLRTSAAGAAPRVASSSRVRFAGRAART